MTFLLSICENFGREYGILGKRKAEVIIVAKALYSIIVAKAIL